MKKKFILLFLPFLIFSSFSFAQTRPDLNNLPPHKLQRLRDKIMDYVTQPIIDQHANAVGIHHGMVFITWHRTYLEGLEAYLDQTGNGDLTPLPFWDPKNPIPAEFFAVAAVKPGFVPLEIQDPQITTQLFSNIDCNDFNGTTHFLNQLIGKHNAAHNTVGGAMGPIMTSPSAAIFWPLHAWVDKAFLEYEVACPPPPPISVNIVGPSSGYNYGTYTWNSSVVGGQTPYASYQWEYSYNGSTYYGLSTNASFTGQLPINQNLYLRLTVTDSNGDPDTDTHFVFNRSTIPRGGGRFPFFTALENNGSIQLYPNPAVESVRIDLPEVMEYADIDFLFMNMHGQEIQVNPTLSSHELIFDTRKLSPGMYMLMEISGEQKQIIGKFVKK